MGDVVWSVATLVTLNLVGAPIAHAGMHVTAVLHSYDTDLSCPGTRTRECGPAAGQSRGAASRAAAFWHEFGTDVPRDLR